MAANMITIEHLQGSKRELIEKTRRLLSHRETIVIRMEFAKVQGHQETTFYFTNYPAKCSGRWHFAVDQNQLRHQENCLNGKNAFTLNKTANALVNAGFAALARCIFVRTQKFGIPAGHALGGWALGTRALLFKYTNA
jgi:hypothetical protein